MSSTALGPGYASEDRPGARARLRAPGARRWYFGATFGLVYQVIELAVVWTSSGSLERKLGATTLLVVLYALYLFLPPLIWPETVRIRVLAIMGYWAASCVLFPLIGLTTIWVWTLIAAMVGFTWIPRRHAILIATAIVLAQAVIAGAAGFPDTVSFAPFITAAVAISTIASARQIVQNQELRLAHAEIARLAVSEERARLARDLHDSLGHSLTVVTVKSELAGKLLERDPVRAALEIADIEALARNGLAELRAAVAGYRDADLDNELVAAHTALRAAGVVEHLPHDASMVDAELRGLFGWVVREGVTNVIRHAGARNCWIDLTARSVRVRDDGRPQVDGGSAGSGLRGLRERAEAVGAQVIAGPRPDGGFELMVSR